AEDGTLRLHHFVSVNNDDFANPQAKFFEVLAQLAAWMTFNLDAQKKGTAAFMDAANHHHFPGLGVVRKYQLMHHL
ncbi:sce7725 family protein, partial [Lacticaseibacillus paracasei]|uniref:sce7725 family protein n=1 Tax=Lacticaseibacillus paracasei TaxID=1597 RepID=UPI00336BAADC